MGYFENWAIDSLGSLHLLNALLALVSGATVLLIKKGTLAHRITGLTYFISMMCVNVSALSLYKLSGSFNFFHFAALASLATILPAYYFVIKARVFKQPRWYRVHGELMIWSYYGLLLALVAETVTRVFPFMLHGEGGWQRFMLFLTIAMALGAVLTRHLIRRS